MALTVEKKSNLELLLVEALAEIKLLKDKVDALEARPSGGVTHNHYHTHHHPAPHYPYPRPWTYPWYGNGSVYYSANSGGGVMSAGSAGMPINTSGSLNLDSGIMGLDGTKQADNLMADTDYEETAETEVESTFKGSYTTE